MHDSIHIWKIKYEASWKSKQCMRERDELEQVEVNRRKDIKYSINYDCPCSHLCRCITTTLSDSQLQSIERESANRSLFARELIVGTLSQALPELLQQQCTVQTPASSVTTATTSPETPNANTSIVSTKKLSLIQEAKRDQATSKHVTQTSTQQQSHILQAAAATGSVGSGLQNQGLPPNPNSIATQNSPIVQTLMHSVLPQPLVSIHFSSQSDPICDSKHSLFYYDWDKRKLQYKRKECNSNS